MSFAHQLDRLRRAVSARQRGMREGTVVVQQSDLRELLYHFDRIEADYRFISADPRPTAQPGAVTAEMVDAAQMAYQERYDRGIDEGEIRFVLEAALETGV